MSTPQQIPALTGIRFVAVSMVFLVHYSNPSFGVFLRAICNQFYFSMDVFFVLSGFLICYNFGKDAGLNKPFLKRFYINRIGRIIPLYYILVTFTFLMLHFRHEGGNHLFGIYLLNISFIKGLSESYIFTGIFPSWSLTPEMTFYFLFPFIHVLITRFNFSWWKQIIVIWVIGLLVYLFFQRYPFKGFFADFDFMLFVTFFGRCFDLLLGVQLAFILINWQAKNDAKNTAGNSRSTLPVYTLVGGILTIIVLVTLAHFSPDKPSTNTWFGRICLVPVFPLLVAALFFGLATEVTWLSRLLSTSLFQVLGKCTYAFYLIHTGFIADWIALLCKDNVMLIYVSIIIVSVVLFYLVEQPLHRLIKVRTTYK